MKSLAIIAAVMLGGAATQVYAAQHNIDQAVADAVSDYKSGGEAAMKDRAQVCYDSADYAHGNETLVKDVEYCYAFETAAIYILGFKGEYQADRGYFNAADYMVRAAHNLERARVVTLPEQFAPYTQKRAAYIKTRVAKTL